MNPLIRALVQSDEMDHAEAHGHYRRLLESGSDKAADVAQMKRAAAVLGKSSADLTADLQTIQRARELQKRIAEGQGLDQARFKAAEDLTAFNADTQKEMQERRKYVQVLVTRQSDLEQRHLSAQEAERQLRELKSQHGPLLADVAVPIEPPQQKPAA